MAGRKPAPAKPSRFAETATEQQNLCLELIKKFRNIEDVEPSIKSAVAAFKQLRKRRLALAGKPDVTEEPPKEPPPIPTATPSEKPNED